MMWITQCRTQNNSPDGLIFKEKVESFAKELGHLNFTGTNYLFENLKNVISLHFWKCEVKVFA